MIKQEPAAWLSKDKFTGAEQLHRVPVQSIPAGRYEFTPLYRDERAGWRLCLLVWFVAGALSWEILRHLVMAVVRAWL